MEFRYLKTFYYASIYLNYSKAAKKVNFTQSAVTKQIKALESEIGLPLFVKLGNRVQLTPAGEILQRTAREILEINNRLEGELQTLRNVKNTLRIGADISFLTNNLQPVLINFNQKYPKLQLEIVTQNSSLVLPKIIDDDLDIGIISGKYENPSIKRMDISLDPIILVLSEKLLNSNMMNQTLKKFPLLKYQSRSYYAQQINDFIVKNKLSNLRSINFSNLEAIKSAALEGLGVAIITKDIVQKEINSGKLVILEPDFEEMFIKTSMIYRRDKEDWETIVAFKESIKSYWKV